MFRIRLRVRSLTHSLIAARALAPSATSSSPPASTLRRADSDPWTVPQSVRDRFVQDGHRFYFPDGAPAFRDLGRRLTTVSENTQVVRTLIEIAHSRGWTEVTVSGTERFRQEAWRQARLEGLAVRGYRPTDEQQAQLIRALARSLARPGDSISADVQPGAAAPSTVPRQVASHDLPRDRVAGRLADHGRDAYRHDPNEEPSYFVRLQTRDGVREVWGQDIERAVAKSLTQPQVGDEVILQRTGHDAVTVTRQERDAQGNIASKEVDAYRNRWVIEKKEFFEQRAEAAHIVRDEAVGPREAVRRHPELTGTYLNLRAAELASKALRDTEDQRQFVARVRGALADGIERGEPLQPVRLRERANARAAQEREPVSRE
jgi:Large polyvalent protein-associated domain 7